MPKSSTFEYLQGLNAKELVSSQEEKAEGSAFLGVVIGKKTFYIPVEHVYKVASDLLITELCHTRPCLQGIAQIDGNVYSVLNIVGLIDAAEASPLKCSSVVALSKTNGNYALLVEKTIGMRRFAPFREPSETLLTLDYEAADGSVLSVLSIEKLVSSSELSSFSVFNNWNEVLK